MDANVNLFQFKFQFQIFKFKLSTFRTDISSAFELKVNSYSEAVCLTTAKRHISTNPHFHRNKIKPIPRVFPILWTLVCPLIDETSRAKFLFYATDGQRGDQLAAQSAGLRCNLIPFFYPTLSLSCSFLHHL